MTATTMLSEARAPRALTMTRAAGLAIALADIANSTLYYAGSAAGLFPQDVLIPGLGTPVTIARILTSTTIGVGLGAGVFALLRRRSDRAYRVFSWIALVILVASYTQPPMVLHSPLRMTLALCVLHTVAAAILLTVLRRVGGRRSHAGR
jgi:hypothetical protein